MTIRILCVDDHPIVRTGLVQLAASEPDLLVIGEADDGEDAVQLTRELTPDLVIMDMRLRKLDGIAATRRIRELPHAPPVLVLSSYAGDEAIHAALGSGASGYVLKEYAHEELIAAIRAVASERRYISREVAFLLARNGPRVVLTHREREVLRALGSGARNREIAAQLGMTEATARTHVQNILEKFGSHDRGHAVAAAIARGFIDERDLIANAAT